VGSAQTLKLPPHEKIVLKNGLTLLVMEKHGVPIVSFSAIVRPVPLPIQRARTASPPLLLVSFAKARKNGPRNSLRATSTLSAAL